MLKGVRHEMNAAEYALDRCVRGNNHLVVSAALRLGRQAYLTAYEHASTHGCACSFCKIKIHGKSLRPYWSGSFRVAYFADFDKGGEDLEGEYIGTVEATGLDGGCLAWDALPKLDNPTPFRVDRFDADESKTYAEKYITLETCESLLNAPIKSLIAHQ